MCQQWIHEKQVLTHQETHLMQCPKTDRYNPLHYIGDSNPNMMHFVLCSEQIWMTVCKDSNVRLVRTQRERERERQRTRNKELVTLKEKKFSNALADVHLVH